MRCLLTFTCTFEHEESGAKMTSPNFLGLVVIVTVQNSCTSRPIRNTGLQFVVTSSILLNLDTYNL